MGIHGLKTFLDSDPRRFSRPWRWNSSDQRNGDDNVHMLIDGMSLLYHVAATVTTETEDDSLPASPANLAIYTTDYLNKLLEALGYRGFLHIFLDGLAPQEKLPSQLRRLQDQALAGDIISVADGSQRAVSGQSKKRILHLLAECAFVEAIEDLIEAAPSTNYETRLFLHRPTHGEAEACIHHWIVKNIKNDMNHVVVLSNDTDFFVFPSCPGFIPFSSLQVVQTLDGQLCITGTHYLRPSLLASFLPMKETTRGWIKDDVMVAVAMFAGCDYVLDGDKMDAIDSARRTMVKSRIGGLKQKKKNNPTAAAALTAILRFIASHIRATQHSGIRCAGRNAWFLSLADAANPSHSDLLVEAFEAYYSIYLHPLRTESYSSSLNSNPVRVDVQRLFDMGIFIGRPIVESWGKTTSSSKCSDRGQIQEKSVCVSGNSLSSITEATVQSWMSRGSVWSYPIFSEIRSRFYDFLTSVASRGDCCPNVCPPYWTLITSCKPQIKEFIRIGSGQGVRMAEKLVEVSQKQHGGWIETTGLMGCDKTSDASVVDLACTKNAAILFCLLGDDARFKPFACDELSYGTLFLASLICPAKLALLLLLMGTAPASIHNVLVVGSSTSSLSGGLNLKQVLSFLSVACYHAIFITTGVSMLLDSQDDNSFNRGIRPSQTIRHKIARWIWQKLRDMDCYDHETDSASAYLDVMWAKLNNTLQQQDHPFDSRLAAKMSDWRDDVTPLWSAWCDRIQV